MRQVVFRCTDDTYGMPDPLVSTGTVMILVQDGVAEVGRYIAAEPPENPWPSFDHPINSDELRPLAMAAVLQARPDLDLYGPCLHFICPDDVAAEAVWNNNA